MINVIHEGGEYAVWWNTEATRNNFVLLSVHKREKNALALARKALVEAIMAVEQKQRRISNEQNQKAVH